MVNQDQQGLGFGTEAKRGGENTETEVSVGEIIALYDQKDAGPGRLTKGMARKLNEGMPVTNTETAEPNTESLDNVIIVGGSVLGLTRTRSADGSRASHVRLAVLPVGEFAGSLKDKQSSATLIDVDLDALRRPRQNGAIQDWEVFSVGRTDLQALTGKSDMTISGTHFGVIVFADGRVEYHDNSTNGSTIVSARDMLQSRASGGFEETDRMRVVDFTRPLDKKRYLWQRQFAGQHVVDPQ